MLLTRSWKKAKDATHYSRIILASSLAELAVTIPDVDLVVDLGLCKEIGEFEGLLQVRDFLAPEPRLYQRLGRTSRVKKGVHVRLKVHD